MSQSERTILIIDDSPEDRELYRRYLLRDREYSYTILEAALGEQGLELWQQHQPDAVLLDYQLPDLDGLEFLAKLQPSSQQPCLPVIVVTGQGNEAIAVKAIKAGAQDYLLKGQMTPESLHLAVNGAIETVQLRTQLQLRIERERLVAQITRLLHQTLDLDEILQTTVTQVRQFLQTDRVLIFRWQLDGRGTVITESVGSDWTPLLSTTHHDPCLNEEYIEPFRQGLVTVKPDIYDGSIDPCHVELLASLQVRANLVVPILQNNRLWGMLIAHHCAAPRSWQPLEIDLLKELATQAGIAIQQAELYQQVKSELAQRQRAETALQIANAQLEERATALAASNEELQVAIEELEVAEEELKTQNEELAIAQTQIEQQRQRYQALFEFAPDGYLVTDEWGMIQEANSTVAALLQTSLEQLIGKPLNAFIKSEDRKAFHDRLYQWLTEDRFTMTRQTWELNLQPHRGQAFPVEVSLAQEVEAIQSLRWLLRDITDRKISENALRQSEERLSLAIDGAGMATWDADPQTGKAIWSGNHFTLQGYELVPGGEARFEMWRNRVHPDDLPQVMQAVEQAQQTRSLYCPEYRIIRVNDGQIRWLKDFGRFLYNEAGLAVRFIGVSFDITDRKIAEESLRQSEEFKRRMLESSPDCIKVLNLDGRLIYMNAGGMCLMEIDDFTPYLNAEWLCFWQDEYRQNAQAALMSAKAGEVAVFQGYCPTAKGTPKWWEVIVSPIFDGAGQVEQVLSISRDISDRKIAEKALRQSQERYRCLAESIPQLVWTASEEGMLLDVNQRWSDYTGFTLAQAQISGWEAVVHPDDLPILSQQWAAAVQTDTYYQAEGRMRRADGVYRWHLHQAIPQKNERGQIIWYGTATDIEAQKQLEVERDRLLGLEQAARAEAERANRVKDEFLAVLSHELRSPLNPILGWVKLLQTRKFDATKTAQALATIERNVKLQTQLIDDLLDVARILRGKLTLNASPVNLIFIVESAIETVKTAAIAKSISIHPVLPPIGQVCGDPMRLQQIVWNLLSNAIKFTPTGGRVDISLTRVEAEVSPKYAQITVTDTGIGISPDFLPHIFEYFRQEDASITRQYGGLGLGLAIVRSLVEAHGGTISAASPGEGQGATFTVRLPLLSSVERMSDRPDDASDGELDLAGIRVLLVDDEPDTRELLAFTLKEYGAEVIAVASAGEVLALLESCKPNIIISDIGMPAMDGYTLLRQVRSLPPERGGKIPAIALSAYARIEDRQQALAAGFQGHISKPVEPIGLIAAISDLLSHSILDFGFTILD